MVKKQAIIDNFYLKTFLTGWGICCLVWSFMIFQFWWGNHDWPYISQGVLLSSGLFEARYSLHLLFVAFLKGQLFPVYLTIFTLGVLVAEGLLFASYLEIPKKLENYLFVVLFVGLNPYSFVLFYFVHYMFSLVSWGFIGACFLFLVEKPWKWWKFLLGGVLFYGIIGSYPPNIALIFVLFTAKRLKKYCDKQENFFQICKMVIYLFLQIILGYLGFKITFFLLVKNHFLNLDMYNLALRSIEEVFYNSLPELRQSFLQLFHQRSFMEWEYCLLIAGMIAVAIILVYQNNISKFVVTILLLASFLASRFGFLVSGDSSGFAIFRMEYWGRLGIALFALGVLLNVDSKFIRNMLFLWCVICLYKFVKTDFDIQKIQYLGWQAHQRYELRLKEKILEQGFNIDNKYIAADFGYPRFRLKYFSGNVITGEMSEYPHVFSGDIVNHLFSEEKVSPVAVYTEIKGDLLVKHPVKTDEEMWKNKSYWQDNPENMKNIRFWLYNEAKGNGVYVDDKYIILVLETKIFYQKRELVANWLDK